MVHSSVNHRDTVISAQDDLHIRNRDSESGLDTLLRLGVSLGAIHDSGERSSPPNCYPNTRKVVRKIILDWICSKSSASFFLWLYGPAGAGKTEILQAIAELLCRPSESSQNFGGSFFFSRGKTGRDQGHFLFSTIAYQLALKVPGLRQQLNRIMESNPTLHTKSMDVQLRTLIVDAFQNLSPLPQRPYLVIIDGLDECHDKATQQSILRLLRDSITVHKLPLRFLIGSRPESHIRTSFDQESLYTITHRVVLDETFNSGRDIRVLLRDGFAKIRNKNSILSHVEQPWPGEGVIDLLVQRSSGQFIFAATVLKFVGAKFCSPTKQLALVLKPDPTAFSDLDQLYTQILSVYPSAVNIVQVLGTIIACEKCSFPQVIEDILGMEEGELRLVLSGLSSLMDGDEEFLGIGLIPPFAHASFLDYLLNSSRSGPFHVNQQEYESQVTLRSFAFILQSIRSWRTSSITRVLHSATWDYFTSYLPEHFSSSPKVVKEAIMTDINDLLQNFWKTSSDGTVGASFFEMRRLFDILQKCFDNLEMLTNTNSRHDDTGTESDLDALDSPIGAKFKILFDGYRKMFDQSLSKSKDLGDMLKFLPGVVVQKSHISMEGMANLYRIKPVLLERLIKSPIEPLKPRASYPRRYILDDYLSRFLQDHDRSQLYYCDPMLQHISICRRFLSLVDPSNIFGLHWKSHDLSDYVYSHFYDHLCAATTDFFHAQNLPDDHPAVEILHDLEAISYYLDKKSSRHIFWLVQRTYQAILRWADMVSSRLKDVAAVSVSNVDLMERVCRLSNKIYREMLCITTHERITYVTMAGLDQPPSLTTEYMIVLSRDLIAWILVKGKIPYSFTNFITTPELSGPLYISPDIYHTQITEFLLISYFDRISDRNLWEHLSHAIPTETIFFTLRSIRSDRFKYDYATELILDKLEIIIRWLQGLGSERPSDLYELFQDDLRRYKALPRRLR